MSALIAHAYFGQGETGKSTRVKRLLARRARSRLVWDTMDEYREHAELVPTLTSMLATASAARKARRQFHLRYVPRGTDQELTARFEGFCALAFELGELDMVTEELQRVTRPSWAPAAWSDCTLRGRHRELAIFGVSQRPASVDKNFFSQATTISTGRLLFRPDVECMSAILGIPGEWIMALPNFEHVELDTKTGALVLVDAQGRARALDRPAPRARVAAAPGTQKKAQRRARR